MSKADFINNGYTSTNAFDETFIRDLQKIIQTTKLNDLNFGKNAKIQIIDWRDNDILFKKCLKSVKEKICENTDISYDFLNKHFTQKVYLSSDTNISTHQNQIPHFDSYPAIKLQIHLSDNSNKNTGCTVFVKSSHNSLLLKIIRFLRIFYIPGKFGMKENKLYKKTIADGEHVFGVGAKYTGMIFDTDTLHYAGKVESQNFIRKIIRFDFQKRKTLGFFCDAIFSKIRSFLTL
jgi:hypothetical protein